VESCESGTFEMHIHVVPLTSENLDQCTPFWGGIASYHPRERQQVFAAASILLNEQRAFGAIVFEGKRPRAFGMTAFVDERFLEGYLDDPRPQIGKELLVDTFRGGNFVLTRDQIGERNAASGGQLVILNCGWNRHAPSPEQIFARVVAATFDTHRGYRVARVLNESFGNEDVELLMNSEYEIRRVFAEIAPGVSTPSAIGTLTREQAFARGKGMLPLFAYTPPRIFFTTSERALLEAACAGRTDENLSAHLGIPLTAVKGRWKRIQRRAAAAIPELFATVPLAAFEARRGAQTRHVLLNYLRHNPSELTPYRVQDDRKNARGVSEWRQQSLAVQTPES
jgi:hypothetical protein